MSSSETQGDHGKSKERSLTDLSVAELVSMGKEIITHLSNIDTLASETTIQGYLDVVVKLKEEYITRGTNEILEKGKEYIGKIKIMLEKAIKIISAIGVDVSECFKDKETEIENLAERILNSFKEDILDIEKQILETLNKSMDIIGNVKNEIAELPGKLSSNLISWDPKASMKKVLETFKEMAENIPVQITSLVTEAAELINSIPVSLLNCIKNAVAKLDNESSETLYNIGICVAGKIRDGALEYLTN